MKEVKRFVIEYANWKMKEVGKWNDPESVKMEAERKIDRIVWAVENGFIVIDEAMQKIAEI